MASKNLQHNGLSTQHLLLGVHGDLGGVLKIGGLEHVVKLEQYKSSLILDFLQEIAGNILGEKQDHCNICVKEEEETCKKARAFMESIGKTAPIRSSEGNTENLIKSLDKVGHLDYSNI